MTSQEIIDYIAYIQLTTEISRDKLAALPKDERVKKKRTRLKSNIEMFLGPGRRVNNKAKKNV